ncbi:hypothetical protein O4J55_24750, partial [Paracoccus sp. PXZ]
SALPGLRPAPAPLAEDRDFAPQPELIDPETHYAEEDEPPSNAAISARISDAIRTRSEGKGLLSAVTARLTGARAAPV